MTRTPRRWLYLSTLAFALGLAPAGRADDAAAPLARADLDARVVKVVADAIRTGAAIYNDGNQEGCYRFYQGTLMAVGPLLDHRLTLRDAVTAGLDKAGKLTAVDQRAFALRETLEQVYAALSKGTPAKKALWDRLGGETAVRAVIHDFVSIAAGDPKVNFTRNGKFTPNADGVKRLEQLLVEFVSSATGGPPKYAGRDMKTTHAGMKITEEEFGALAADLVGVLKKYKVPQAEIDELVAIIATTKKDIVEK